MASESNVLAFKGSGKRSPLNDGARRLVSGCRQLLLQTLATLMDGLFETVDDALYGLADRSDTTKTQTTYFDAMRLLRRQRGHIQTSFLNGVLTGFDAFWEQGPRDLSLPVPSAASGAGLSLLDEDELEAALAVANLISKGENRFHRELYRLNLRFSLLLGGVGIDATNNPLGPTGICAPFHNTVQGLALDVQVRLVMYKLFDKQIVQHVGNLYEEINRLFKRAGIDPPVSPSGTASNVSRPDAASAQHGRQQTGGRGSAAANSDVDTSQADIFNTLRTLLEGQRGNPGRQQLPKIGALPTVEQSELLGALSALQHGGGVEIQDPGYQDKNPGTKDNDVDVRLRLTEHLCLQKNGMGQRILAQADQDTLDVIAMLFDFLLTDPHLPDALKALIARLQIPLLKVAILDKTFFSGNQHPARKLLNNLARAAVAWSDDGDRSPESLYGHISSIVQRVISNFEEDPGIFAQLNKEFSTYLEREQRVAEVTEQRTTQITRGKEQLKQAKERVTAEIVQRLNTSQMVPLVAKALLEEGWKDVLLLTYLRQGPESVVWREQLGVAERLLWSVQPKADHEQRQALLRAIPDLLSQLREGLNGISYDQHRMMRLLEELQSCHLACLRGNEYFQIQPALFANAAQKPITMATYTTADSTEGGESLYASSSNQALDDVARGLAVGTWIEISESAERQIRVKLSWKSEAGDAYVFVNRKGIKVLEMTTSGVLRLFRSGQATLLDNMDTPIVDRAVDAVLASLQEASSVRH